MRTLLLASLVIALAAVSAPAFFKRYMEGTSSVAANEVTEIDAATGETRETSPASDLVEIAASDNGHFYVEAEINFGRVRMMVDTGATTIALRESDALEAGIRLRPGDFVHPVQTANGMTHAAEAELDTIAIGSIEIENVRALVIPDDQLAISLLGGSFLSRLARFEVAEGTLIFEN
jgi:aspartyl protease family protein